MDSALGRIRDHGLPNSSASPFQLAPDARLTRSHALTRSRTSTGYPAALQGGRVRLSRLRSVSAVSWFIGDLVDSG